jgi:hypothetical protein
LRDVAIDLAWLDRALAAEKRPQLRALRNVAAYGLPVEEPSSTMAR